MSWVSVGVAAGTAGLGYMENKRNREMQQDRENRTRAANAAATEVSWARKDGRGSIPEIQWAELGKSDLGAALQGGLQGYMLGNSIKSGMKSPDVENVTSTGQPDYAGKLAAETPSFGEPSTSPMGGLSSQNSMPGMTSNPMAGGTTMDWDAMGQKPGLGFQMAKKPSFWGN